MYLHQEALLLNLLQGRILRYWADKSTSIPFSPNDPSMLTFHVVSPLKSAVPFWQRRAIAIKGQWKCLLQYPNETMRYESDGVKAFEFWSSEVGAGHLARQGSFAVLSCIVRCCAVLCCAVLCCAVLCCAVLCCAVLCCAVLCCAVVCVACRISYCTLSGVMRYHHQSKTREFT
jgi:hypothetical protein